MPGRGPFYRARLGARSIVWTDDEEQGLPGSPDVEDFAQPPLRKAPPRQLLFRYPWFLTVALSTLVLVAVTVVDWLSAHESFASSKVRVFELWQPATLVLAMLSHADLVHLLSNLVGFIGFGMLLKRSFGLLAFPIVPAIVGIIANLLTILSTPPSQGIIGSSGMVFAMVGLYLTLYFVFEFRHSSAGKLMRVLGIVLILLFPHEYSASTSYVAHAYGFAGGVVSGLIIAPVLSPSSVVPEVAPEVSTPVAEVREEIRFEAQREETVDEAQRESLSTLQPSASADLSLKNAPSRAESSAYVPNSLTLP